ncbi:MAG: acireductone synthase [Planctomycetaceae bacterium]|nr:acireductone synthase [Planctomycetaceae bacterium]
MEFTGRGILLDIEGTTSSISFVYDVMFPYIRRELAEYLVRTWGDADLQAACELIAVDAGFESFAVWREDLVTDGQRQQLVHDEVNRLMDGDTKATGLKQLQGLIWKAGFEDGELRAHVYDDVTDALTAWNQMGVDVRVYSSGSIAAQRLFFGHTVAGDLLHCFRGHYDTTTGSKRESSSYSAIAVAFGLRPEEILFMSDVVAELDAARAAGLQTTLVIRPGNVHASASHVHPEIESFAEVKVCRA